ncbi:hypothetical protein F5X97DRAFT_321038 [Nemania serpens]|nr:hypothetical protein F5X97DRAFT_321038 [Nemania serpens]
MADDDRRPESSPFGSSVVEVDFEDQQSLFVPSILFDKCPELKQWGKWPRKNVSIGDITSGVGHVIFYYLLTDTYQCLKPKGSSGHEKLVDEMTISVGVYNASQTYNLPGLQDIAKGEIHRLAQELPFPLVLNLLRNVHLDLGVTEPWLDDYVQSGLRNIFKTPAAFLDDTIPQVHQGVISFSNIILKNLANMLANNAAPDQNGDIAIPEPSPRLDVIEEEPVPSIEPAPVSEIAPLLDLGEPTPSVLERVSNPDVDARAIDEDVLRLESDRSPTDDVYSPIEQGSELAKEPIENLLGTELEPSPEPLLESAEGAIEHTPVRVEDLESLPEPVSEPVPESVPEPALQPEPQPEPEPTPELEPEPKPEQKPEQKPEPEPEPEPQNVPEPAPEPAPEAPSLPPSITPSKVAKKTEKKRLSFFRSEEQPPEPPKLDIVDPPAAPAPKPEPEPAPAPAAEPEARPADDALSTTSPSAPPSTAAKKKKKKRSLFRNDK